MSQSEADEHLQGRGLLPLLLRVSCCGTIATAYGKGKEKAPELVHRGNFFSEVRVTVVSAFHRGHLAQDA